MFQNKNNGLTTIEEVREEYDSMYNIVNDLYKVKLKAWLHHSESRHKNGNKPFTFQNHSYKMPVSFYCDLISLDVIDVSDIGSKESIEEKLKRWE